jgi:hypothetical protein
MATKEHLTSDIAAWQQQRNASGARIKWMFTTEKAHGKMSRAYPEQSSLQNPTLESHNHCVQQY